MELEFIIKDKGRLAMINDLCVQEPITLHRLAAKNRIPKALMGRILRSMEEKEVIELIDDEYRLTDSGREMIKHLKKIERIPSPHSQGPGEGSQVRMDPDHKRKQIDRIGSQEPLVGISSTPQLFYLKILCSVYYLRIDPPVEDQYRARWI